MRNFQRKNILFYSLISSFIILFYQFNNTWVGIHEDDQVSGCDSFGYARQAQLFRKSNNFFSALDTSINTDVQNVLNNWGKNTSIKYRDWYQMVAPHAHYFRDDSRKVILQYPPGTGWLLSIFKENKARKTLWILSFSLISSLFLSRLNISGNRLTDLSLALSSLGSLYITNTFSTRSDSIAPSCLIAVMITSMTIRSINLLNKNQRIPLLQILLIIFIYGFSLSIRPGNILFLISPISIYLVAYKLKIKYLFRSIILSCAVFFVSIFPFLQANKINTGSFFASTYSSIDTTFDISSFFVNLSFQNESIEDSIRVIIVLIFSLSLSYRAWIQKDNNQFLIARRILIFLAWLFMMLTICLMAFKPVFNLYYLAPQLVMTTSISSMSILITQSCVNRNFFIIDKLRRLFIAFSALIFIFGYLFIKPTFIEPFPFLNQFPVNSIIWADSIGSKLLYYHNQNTAKLNFGTTEAQREIIDYLSKNNIEQFVLDESNLVSSFNNLSYGYLKEVSIYNDIRIYKFIHD